MRNCDIKFVNKEITLFGGLSLFFNYWLRPGNTSASTNYLSFFEDTLLKLEGKRVGLVCMDSGFFAKEINRGMWEFHCNGIQPHVVVQTCADQFQQEEIYEDYPVRVDIDASLSGENKRQAHTIFGQITKNTTIILVYMGKIKGFLFAVRHREILMTDLGLC